jgi:hypothetical protein
MNAALFICSSLNICFMYSNCLTIVFILDRPLTLLGEFVGNGGISSKLKS